MENKSSSSYKTIDKFFTFYLTQRNVEKTLSMLADDVYSIGTGEHEEAFSKKELEKLLISEIKEMPSKIEYSISSFREKKRGINIYDCFCKVTTIIDLSKTEKLYYKTRLVASCTEVQGEFLINSIIMSQASADQEENKFFPFYFESTELKTLDEKSQKELMKILMETVPGGIVGTYEDDKMPVYVINDTMLEMIGYHKYNDFISDTKGLFENAVHPDDRDLLYNLVDEGFKNSDEYKAEYRLIKKDGSVIWIYDVGRRIVTEDGRLALICIIIDISETVLAKKHLIEENMRDPLTNLYNRKAGEKLISNKLQQKNGFIVLIMDIDNFKQVNDICGHHMGDTILIFLANQLLKYFHSPDIIVRLGGDEFIIYVSSEDRNINEINQKLNEISDMYIKKIQELCPSVYSTLSVGGIFGAEIQSFTDVYQSADKVLYDIKNNKKGCTKIIHMI